MKTRVLCRTKNDDNYFRFRFNVCARHAIDGGRNKEKILRTKSKPTRRKLEATKKELRSDRKELRHDRKDLREARRESASKDTI
jgi:hypothetical protein